LFRSLGARPHRFRGGLMAYTQEDVDLLETIFEAWGIGGVVVRLEGGKVAFGGLTADTQHLVREITLETLLRGGDGWLVRVQSRPRRSQRLQMGTTRSRR